jgi:hypothetical protein
MVAKAKRPTITQNDPGAIIIVKTGVLFLEPSFCPDLQLVICLRQY